MAELNTIIMMNAIFFFSAFLFMEFVAWFAHKYVMHGFLWILHKDHHAPHRKTFERNDLFAFMFAVPSFLLIYFGITANYDYKLWLGLGIALYGFSYFLFHDILFHQRIRLFKQTHNLYFRAVVKAHGDHHKGKKNYGFLFMFPWKYFKLAKNK